MLSLLAVSFDAQDPDRLAQFWGSLLGRSVDEGTQIGLRFVSSEAEKTAPNRVHLHLTSDSLPDQQQSVAMALDLGARHVDVGQLPEEGHVVLADPEGNEFCVIEPDNDFLAGCGFLGEIACVGTRDVGLFWSEALGWPLVWDQDQETAIQSPHGGTKVAWGGQPRSSQPVATRQRLDVLADGDRDAELDRLVSLGATRLRVDERGTVVLTDPDGTEFTVR